MWLYLWNLPFHFLQPPVIYNTLQNVSPIDLDNSVSKYDNNYHSYMHFVLNCTTTMVMVVEDSIVSNLC